jgi:hypothetical protein
VSVPAPVTTYLDRTGRGGARVVPLTPDASDRRYFRVLHAGESPLVVALHATPFAPGSLPFLNVLELFTAMDVPVPRLLDEAAELGILVLEDLGDLTLQAHLGAVPEDVRHHFYAEATTLIRQIQQRGRDLTSPRFVPYGVAFDVEKLTWEMEFFIKHFLVAYRGMVLPAPALEALREELAAIVEEIAGEPRVLCHRDYHSRNLMVHTGRLFVIDFQDARMGPDTYDLVSLLRDSYVDLPEPLVDDAIATFAQTTGHRDLREFRRRFDLMALQRNLKALGTFGFQATSRDNPVYAQYVPRTLRHVRENFDRNPRFDRLRAILARGLPEVAEGTTP